MANIMVKKECQSYINDWRIHYGEAGKESFRRRMLSTAIEQRENMLAAERIGRDVTEYRESVALLFSASM